MCILIESCSHSSIYNYVGTCPASEVDLTSYFPYLQVGSKLSKDQVSMLERRLYDETDKIQWKFASFMFDLQKDLEKNQYSACEIVDFLVYYNKKFKSLSSCTTVSGVFRELRSFVSFFDFELLEQLSGKFGSDLFRRN